MKRQLSIIKLNIIIVLFLWGVLAAFGILKSFDISRILFSIILIIYTFCLLILLCIKYKPFVKKAKINNNNIVFHSKYLDAADMLHVFEVNPVEKILFILKSPQFDYSSSFFNKGLILKTLYDSYLIDDTSDYYYINTKKIRKVKYRLLSLLLLFYTIVLIPVISCFAALYIGLDPMIYVTLAIVIIYIVLIRFIPIFYLGTKLDCEFLPLAKDEVNKFKNIVLIKGFIFSDRLSIIPFKKFSYLDGLAINIFFKKYIILNPRLFTYGCDDYLRFVLFHELCHIEHHDGSDAILVTIFIFLLELIINFSSNICTFIESNVPFYDYILGTFILLYFILSFWRRKKIESRADRYAITIIGIDAVARIYELTNIKLNVPII